MSMDINAEIEKIKEAEQNKADVLRQLLNEKTENTTQVVVTRSHMGTTDTYLGSASLRWIHQNVRLFTQLELFTKTVDPETGAFIVDESNVAELRQRAPNWSRQPILVNYLIRHKTRLFPPMLVVVEEPWVSDLSAGEWVDGRAIKTSIPFEPLNDSGSVGLISVDNLTAYVIDGSHRWIGISGIIELLGDDKLTLKKRDGAPTGKVEHLYELLEKFELSSEGLSNLDRETMGIEFIPAVMKGETHEEARRRVRSVFVHVNKAAEPPTRGETVLLDDDDGFSIVARAVALSHPLLRNKKAGDRVNWRSSALPAGGTWLTTGTTLRDMTNDYLKGHDVYNSWTTTTNKEIGVRPPESQITDGMSAMTDLLDRISKLPSFAAIMAGDKIDAWREFPDMGTDEIKGKGHLLMRPLGQLILADAVGYLHNDVNGPHMNLEDIFEMLSKFDSDGGFEGVTFPKSYWWGITYNPNRGVMSMQGEKTAINLLRHLLHDDTLTTKDREGLRDEFAKFRTVETGIPDKEQAFNYDGMSVTPDEVTLPPMI